MRLIPAFSDPKSLFIILIGGLLTNMGLLPEKTRVNVRQAKFCLWVVFSGTRDLLFLPHLL